ncbi:MAG TPA: PAS domain S-box protein [Gammaproteobacteria bacterium]
MNLHAVFDSLPGIYLLTEADDSYRIIAVSDGLLEASMRRREDLVGKSIFEAFPGNAGDIRKLRESLERVRTHGHEDEMPVLHLPVRRSTRDGGAGERYWSTVNAPVFDGNGKLTHIIQHIRDVTELIRHEQRESETSAGQRQLESRARQMEADLVQRSQELKRLNEHLSFAQRIAHIGSMELGIGDGQRTWSDEVYNILGLDRGTPPSPEVIAAIVHPDDRPLLDAARERAMRGEQAEFEHRIVRPDGEVRHVRERVQLVRDDDGRPERLFGTLQDITENRQEQERLQRSEHLMRAAGQMAKLGAWQLDVAEQEITWSDEVAAIHELPPGSRINFADALRYVAPKWRDTIREALDACIHEGKPYDLEFQIVTAKGRRAWARVIGQAVYDAHGKVACVRGALQDITQKKQAEAKIENLAERLTATFESISDGFATVDNQWRLTFMNRQAERIVRRPREEILGKNIWEEYKEAAGTGFEHEYRRAKAENRTVTFEEYFPPLKLWLDVTAYPSPDGLAVYFRDITDRKQAEAARRESEERTQLIVRNALDAVITIDAGSVITGWNPQAEKTFGWSRDEAVGGCLYELVIPEAFRAAHRRGIARFLETGEGPLLNRHTEVTALHRDGHEFPVELSIVALKGSEGFTFSAFVRDITERKQADEALHRYAEHLAATFDKVQTGICEVDLDGRFRRVNPAFAELLGYTQEELKGRNFAELTHPDDLEAGRDALRALASGEIASYQAEKRYLRRDGKTVWVALRSTMVRNSDGEAVYALTTMHDVTERKEHEMRLQQQAALLDQARDAIIVRDVDNRITYWNKGAERLYGWTAGEAIGRDMEELLQPSPQTFHAAVRHVLEKDEWNGEITKRRKDGSIVNIDGAWTLARDDNGRPQSILTIDTNITERLALEEQLRQSQRLESIGKLTGGVAHDFNNLLTVILGNAELMLDRVPAGDPLHKLAEMSRTAANRGAELTHRLLAFARRQALEPHMIDVNQLVLGMEDLLRRTLLENIDLEVIPRDNAWWAFVDPGQLEAVLLNLAINARDAMPEGGLLTIEIDNVELDDAYAADNAEVTPGRYVMIAVSDTGHGIPPENLGRVFDPFFTTKEKGKGTGLGLSMAYGFAKQSEGHIKIYSEPGQGTTVRLYLRRANRAEEAATLGAGTKTEPSGSEKVLIVEDDELVREHAASQLQKLGYNVIAAPDGPRALEIMKRESDIDLLFTDVIMSGGMTGRELAETAKRLRPKLKVLYTSGYTENAIVHQGRLDRGVHLLQKPYQRTELAKKLRQALQESGRKDNDRDKGNDKPHSDTR